MTNTPRTASTPEIVIQDIMRLSDEGFYDKTPHVESLVAFKEKSEEYLLNFYMKYLWDADTDDPKMIAAFDDFMDAWETTQLVVERTDIVIRCLENRDLNGIGANIPAANKAISDNFFAVSQLIILPDLVFGETAILDALKDVREGLKATREG